MQPPYDGLQGLAAIVPIFNFTSHYSLPYPLCSSRAGLNHAVLSHFLASEYTTPLPGHSYLTLHITGVFPSLESTEYYIFRKAFSDLPT